MPESDDHPRSIPTPLTPPAGLFFVGGARKSGTTWLVGLLNSHPEVFCTGEGFFVGDYGLTKALEPDAFRRWFNENTVQWSWMEKADFDDALADVRRGMIEGAMRSHLKRKNVPPTVRMIGDKTPGVYCRHAEELHRLFPDGKFIDIIRDGRDVAVSDLFMILRVRMFDGFPPETREFLERARRAWIDKDGSTCPLFNEHMIRFEAGVWRSTVLGGRRAARLFGENYISLRYEDLLREPHRIASVYELLGVDASDEIVRACVEANSFEKKTGRKPGQEKPEALLRKAVAGDWRNHFTDADHDLYCSLTGDLLAELGYDVDEPVAAPPGAGLT